MTLSWIEIHENWKVDGALHLWEMEHTGSLDATVVRLVEWVSHSRTSSRYSQSVSQWHTDNVKILKHNTQYPIRRRCSREMRCSTHRFGIYTDRCDNVAIVSTNSVTERNHRRSISIYGTESRINKQNWIRNCIFTFCEVNVLSVRPLANEDGDNKNWENMSWDMVVSR